MKAEKVKQIREAVDKVKTTENKKVISEVLDLLQNHTNEEVTEVLSVRVVLLPAPCIGVLVEMYKKAFRVTALHEIMEMAVKGEHPDMGSMPMSHREEPQEEEKKEDNPLAELAALAGLMGGGHKGNLS